MILDIISASLIVAGTILILLSAIGLLKLPDIYMRMSATTKSATLGVGTILLGTAIFFWEVGILSRGLIIISFLFLTAPVAAHMIGRAAYINKVPLWENSIVDELNKNVDDNEPVKQ